MKWKWEDQSVQVTHQKTHRAPAVLHLSHHATPTLHPLSVFRLPVPSLPHSPAGYRLRFFFFLITSDIFVNCTNRKMR